MELSRLIQGRGPVVAADHGKVAEFWEDQNRNASITDDVEIARAMGLEYLAANDPGLLRPTDRREVLSNKPLHRTVAPVATLPLAAAAERQYRWTHERDRAG